jgi:hypothetical protein
MSEVSHLRTFDIVKPPTSAEVFRNILTALDSENHPPVDLTILGQHSVPKPQPVEISVDIHRVTIDHEHSVKRIVGRTALQQVVIETSENPNKKATVTIVG